MPPLALMSATYISSVFFSGSPRNDAGPVTERMAPILISACAALAAVARNTAATVRNRDRMIFLPAGGPLGRRVSLGASVRANGPAGQVTAPGHSTSPVRQRPVLQPRDRKVGRVI